MSCRVWLLRLLVALACLSCLMVITVETACAYSNEATVRKNARITLSIYGSYEGTLAVWGTSGLEWSDWYYNGSLYAVDMQMMSLDLEGSAEGGLFDVAISLSSIMPSMGQALSPSIPEDWPVESFFDIYLSVSIPALLPGENLHNEIPIHVSSSIDDVPPYFDDYETTLAQTIYLYDESGIARGEMTYWFEECIPYTPPEANITIATSKGSDVAIVEDGTLVAHGAVTGGIEPYEAQFGVRLAGSGLPFEPFWIDHDGSASKYATVRPLGDGDGWAGYLDTMAYPLAGGYYDFEVRFITPDYVDLCDTTTVFVDPTPPIPVFVSIPYDSIGYFRPDSLYNITVTTHDEDPDSVIVFVYPMDPDKFRTLTPVDQNMLGTPWDSMSCVPSAVASCLKYWTDNGYGQLDHPNGDESQPEQSGGEMAEELAGEMGTDGEGTNEDEMESGTESYLDSHGCSGWDVDVQPVSGPDDLAKMLEEFTADGEDVIILVQDTTAEGDTVGHAVTMGSEESHFYEIITQEAFIGCIANQIDFMDPDGGGSTEDNQYLVGYDSEGQPTLDGYDIGGSGGGSQIVGYMKVSPPEAGGSAGIARAPGAAAQEGWIRVSAGSMKGSGQLDTLTWDTTGFAGGVYLLQVSMTDALGHTGRDLRLAGIPEYTVGTDEPETPKMKLNLKGSYPNPFNPTTTIEYSIPRDARVTLAIFNVSGALVRRLVDNEPAKAGYNTATWDGRNDAGKAVASGVYICTLRSEGSASSVKLVLMR
ncbi:MAG: FlgD immunoglobulin-like domain containing protein [Candidatus Krumholzibacteria bacterium]|nr:FlgD immunoglobulin-like domain containing protein [Candidatus Krumholzibacteria bacterium]